MHPMLTDPALAELPYGVFVEPDPTLVSVAFASPIPLDSCRPCPPWEHCGNCRGVGHVTYRYATGGFTSLRCPVCDGDGILNAATGLPL